VYPAAEAPVGLAERVRDFVALTKPRIAILELITVCIGATAAASVAPSEWLMDGLRVVWAVIGTTLVAASASTFNQILERSSDRLMARTENRPLPSGRLGALEASVFGLITGILGFVTLGLLVNTTTTILGAISWLLYVAVYTPLKPRTSLNTVIGAVPGALPIVMGWTAVGGPFTIDALILFGIVFLWQFPHFMAIAWLCRDDYRTAGLQMISINDPQGKSTGIVAVLTSIKLLAVSLLPTLTGLAGFWYFAAALVLGLVMLAYSVKFMRSPTDLQARHLLRASLLYLPLVLLALVLDLTP
jgi:protoheme IX farnesyltransferase